MTEPLLVRPVESSDWSQWHALWLGYNAFYGRAGATALPEAVTAKTWSRLVDAHERVDAYVAQRGTVLAGFAHCVWHPSTTALGPSCYLQDLFTRPDARGTGVGRALIDAVRQHAQSRGASRLYWQTHQANAPARRLYDEVAKNSGFIVYALPLEQA